MQQATRVDPDQCMSSLVSADRQSTEKAKGLLSRRRHPRREYILDPVLLRDASVETSRETLEYRKYLHIRAK